eukprot:scaffold23667_cov71-Cyclotella_meneghiniana.AAC.1
MEKETVEHDRDDVAFWDQQKEEYLNENPSHEAMFAGEEEDDNDGDMVQESGNVGIERTHWASHCNKGFGLRPCGCLLISLPNQGVYT